MSSGLSHARRDLIACRLDAGLPVVAATLAAEFGVSEDAIRRDLRALAAEGQCRRVYGGALPVSPAWTSMAVRMGEGWERNLALARAATSVVQSGELLFLDNGSTNLALATVLPLDRELTVATSSVAIAATVLARRGPRLILVGGTVDPNIGGCVDTAAVEAVQQMNIDRCFLGACSVSRNEGVSAFDATDAAFKRIVLAVSRRAAVMITTDNLGTTAPHRVTTLDRMETLVLEHDARAEDRAALANAGPAILVADPP